jgi:hypothetical protein
MKTLKHLALALLAGLLTATLSAAIAATPEGRATAPAEPAVELLVQRVADTAAPGGSAGAFALPDPQFVATVTEPFIARAAREYPWLFTLVAFIGGLRLIFKPLVSFWQTVCEATPDAEDDARFARWKSSAWFRVLAWILDFGASIKLRRPPPTGVLIFTLCLFPLAFASGGCGTHGNFQRDFSVLTTTTTYADRTVVEREERDIVSKQHGRHFYDSKSAVVGFKAGQSDKKQEATLGSLNTETSSAGAVQTLRILVEGAKSAAVP